jgi:hypothetical protein
MSDGIPVFIGEHNGEPFVNKIDPVEASRGEGDPNGLALTFDQLEQLKREYWEAARQRVLLASGYIKDGKQHVITTSDNLKYRTFEDYEATKKDGE